MASQQQSNTQAATVQSPYTLRGSPDVTFTLPIVTTKSFDIISPTAKELLAETPPLASSALQSEANNRYPLSTTDCPPFSYIDPALIMSPAWNATQLEISRWVPEKLPVVALENLSVGLHKILKKKPGARPPIYHALTGTTVATSPQASTVAGSGDVATAAPLTTSSDMGPPPRAALKRKRVVD
jgi:hypothetical protein